MDSWPLLNGVQPGRLQMSGVRSGDASRGSSFGLSEGTRLGFKGKLMSRLHGDDLFPVGLPAPGWELLQSRAPPTLTCLELMVASGEEEGTTRSGLGAGTVTLARCIADAPPPRAGPSEAASVCQQQGGGWHSEGPRLTTLSARQEQQQARREALPPARQASLAPDLFTQASCLPLKSSGTRSSEHPFSTPPEGHCF